MCFAAECLVAVLDRMFCRERLSNRNFSSRASCLAAFEEPSLGAITFFVQSSLKHQLLPHPSSATCIETHDDVPVQKGATAKITGVKNATYVNQIMADSVLGTQVTWPFGNQQRGLTRVFHRSRTAFRGRNRPLGGSLCDHHQQPYRRVSNALAMARHSTPHEGDVSSQLAAAVACSRRWSALRDGRVCVGEGGRQAGHATVFRRRAFLAEKSPQLFLRQLLSIRTDCASLPIVRGGHSVGLDSVCGQVIRDVCDAVGRVHSLSTAASTGIRYSIPKLRRSGAWSTFTVESQASSVPQCISRRFAAKRQSKAPRTYHQKSGEYYLI
uniref:Uncharacterized protein n=1 Tax=Echinococcus canadensis TaxID=519352 RepID=A0A915ET14_9CEST